MYLLTMAKATFKDMVTLRLILYVLLAKLQVFCNFLTEPVTVQRDSFKTEILRGDKCPRGLI